MYEKGNLDGALKMFNLSLAIQEKSLGSDNPATANTYAWIEDVKQAMDNRDK